MVSIVYREEDDTATVDIASSTVELIDAALIVLDDDHGTAIAGFAPGVWVSFVMSD